MKSLFNKKITQALRGLRANIPQLFQTLKIADSAELRAWLNVMDGKLIPRLTPDFPLTAAICGGGSSGKSTLFNALAKAPLSPTGGRAGMNRRVLIAAHPDFAASPAFLESLYGPFGCEPLALSDNNELITPGQPLYVLQPSIPKQIILLDTPDFDTGAQGRYTNRDLARQSLETADILIYTFTNSNYNNRDNTDFMAEMLTGIGSRQCILVYRVYPSFSDAEVMDHAMTVARNIYGNQAEDHVLGIYRVDEDNAVAAGEKPVALRPASHHTPAFMNAIDRMDPRKIRMELFASILKDVKAKAVRFLTQAAAARDGLTLYLDALKVEQSRCVQESLSHFPMDRAMKRFADIWRTTDPAHIKVLRKTGQIVEMPFKWMVKSVNWFRQTEKTQRSETDDGDFATALKMDLINAANQMYTAAVAPHIEVRMPANNSVAERMSDICHRLDTGKDTPIEPPKVCTPDEKGLIAFDIPAHAVAFTIQKTLKERDWKAGLNTILSHRTAIVAVTEQMESELLSLANDFRSQMGLIDQVRQTFSAFLNVLPATVAVTYVLATGDPVGATSIKVKLAGLFGLKDLYALVAIPATAGIKQADLKQLEVLLGPIAETWINNKMVSVQKLFEAEITGPLLKAGRSALDRADNLIREIESHLASLKGTA